MGRPEKYTRSAWLQSGHANAGSATQSLKLEHPCGAVNQGDCMECNFVVTRGPIA